jgi:crooked neck
VQYAKFEMQNGEVALARKCYERAVEELGEDSHHVGTACTAPCTPLYGPPMRLLAQEEFFIRFAEFEEKVKEMDRARAIYKYVHQAGAQVSV